MIFSGLQGIGKTTMAFRLARFLLKHGKGADDQDGLFGGGEALPQNIESLDVLIDDPVFARIASGGHADLLHIHRAYDATKGKRDSALKVEALRKIEPFLRKTASEGGWRIVLVEDADTMNRNAQNAILKILEEPPANVLIILVAHRPGMLIPTIRSRARVVPFAPLSQEHIQTLLGKQGYDLSAADLDVISALSDGSAGQAIEYIEQEALQTIKMIEEHLAYMPHWQMSKIHELANSLHGPSQDKAYRMFADILQWLFRQVLFVKARGGDVPAHLQKPSYQKMISEYTLPRMIKIVDDLNAHFDRAEFSNLDRRDAVRGAFLVISQ